MDLPPSAGPLFALRDVGPASFWRIRLGALRRVESVLSRLSDALPRWTATSSVPLEGADERLLAWFRLFAATAVVFSLARDEGPGHSFATVTLAFGLLLYTLAVWLVSASLGDWLARRATILHLTDFTWAAVASVISGGTGSHAFPFFAYVLAVAAFRWGLDRALLEALFVAVIGIAERIAEVTGTTPWALEFDHFLQDVSLLTLSMAMFFCVLVDRLHRARHQTAQIMSIIGGVTRARSLRDALSTTLIGIGRTMQASRIVIAAEDTYTGQFAVWSATVTGAGAVTTSDDVPREASADWLPAGCVEPGGCEFRRLRSGLELVMTLLLHHSSTAIRCNGVPRGVHAMHGWRTVLVLPFAAGGAWTGHLYVMDPKERPAGRARLKFLSSIVSQVTPALLILYLQRRLRLRAESVERSRISRELHDTAHQTLAAISMRLELLGRAAQTSTKIMAEVRDLQTLVRDVDLRLRESVAQQRLDLDAVRLPRVLEAIVDRFASQTGIAARFEWDVPLLRLPPRRCLEIVRMVQEALSNARRHSGATSVVVSGGVTGQGWSLIVADNGRGLGFTGRLTEDDPDLERRAPRVIRERARVLGGSVTIESSPGGMRLGVVFPKGM